MNKRLILKKCSKCNALVHVIRDCECGIMCCNSKMDELKENSTDASFEKHLPTYEREENDIIVNVAHVMEENHFIEWICCITENREEYVYFTQDSENATARFHDVKHGTLYSYCNKHGLWKTEIE